MNKCKCGKEGLFQLKNGNWCCSDSHNKCPANIEKNKNGNRKAYSRTKDRLLKKEDFICKFCNKHLFTMKGAFKYHEKTCHENPVNIEYRVCSHCKNLFKTNIFSERKTCSDSCKHKLKRYRNGEKIAESLRKYYSIHSPPCSNKKRSYERTLKDIICPTCHKQFRPKSKYTKYCSNSCYYKNPDANKRHSFITKQKYKEGKKVYGGTTKWIKYKDFNVQGSYEYRTCFILDELKRIGEIKDWIYTNDRFSYVGIDKKPHNYLLDFKVFLKDGSFYYIETKGWQKPNDILKWDAVRSIGHRLEVWYEKEISNEEKRLSLKGHLY